ncbi:MAG: hypothetical protein ACJAWS_000525 [Oleiphilaceae bacterium]|jgi:hypothetical protein
MQTKNRLSTRFYSIKNVSVPQLLEMHKLFTQYYNNTDLQTFTTDMGNKTGVFILEDKTRRRIVGFSTWTEMDVSRRGQKALGIFSGDTVVDKNYWGNRELQKSFAKKLFATKLKNPSCPVFWLLISKGYKTYLLLTNNFHKFYPNHQTYNKQLESIVDEYCTKLYPAAYCQESRLLDFGDKYQKLKEGVAGITLEMKEQNRDIRHFEKLNPTWDKGTELPCAGEVTISMLLDFMKRNMVPFKKPKSRQRSLAIS